MSKGDSPLRGEMSRSDRGARARRAGRVSGLGDSDGPYVTTRSRATARPLQKGGLPPSLAPLVHNDSRQSVGAGHARPATLLCPPSTGRHPLTPAAAWGQAALRTPFKVACRGGGDPSAGRRGRRPLQRLCHYPFACCRGGFIPPGKAFLTPRSSHPRQNRVLRSGLKSHASAWAKSHPPGASLSDFPR